MIEFTGERVVPGHVDNELWDEHVARYAFARRFAAGKRVLDVGCGTGYGTQELAESAQMAVGIDSAQDAIQDTLPSRARFIQASASALPFPSASFDLVTAFEVIEHLDDWNSMLAEAKRVLSPRGSLIISTPNKLSYAESRASIGPNPFHVHEFEFAEFRDALRRHFAFTTILLQNRAEAFVFTPAEPSRLNACSQGAAADQAQFFVAVCTDASPTQTDGYVFLATTSNLLREREQHIRKLEDELALTKQWLASTTGERDQLLAQHTRLKAHLEDQNRWALGLETEWKAALARISQLQDEFHAEQRAAAKMAADYEQALADLRAENDRKTQWAIDTEARLTQALQSKCEELTEAVRLLDRAEATVTERTLWAQTLQTKIDDLERRLQMIRASRWLKLGRAVGLGPRVDGR